MHWKYNLAHLILVIVVALVLTPLMVCAAPPAQIAFVSERDGSWNIYVMDANGRNQQKLTNTRRGNWHPSWSPDGKRIVFSSEMDGSWNIYVMDTDGRNQQKLTNTRRGNWHPSWSPDGKRIVFSSEMDGSWNIYVMDTDGRNQQKLTNTRQLASVMVTRRQAHSSRLRWMGVGTST